MMMLSPELRFRLNARREQVERLARRMVFGARPTWHRRPDLVPWADLPDALERLPGGADAALLEKWVRDGYVVVDGCVDTAALDEMVATLEGLWDAAAPIRGLELLDLHERRDVPPRNLTHAELLALPPETRQAMRAASDWRIHAFHHLNAAAARVFREPRLRRVASRLLGRRARPIAAINFMTGSQQSLHQDMAVFHIYPRNWLLGAWIACEDVTPESGPLIYYPGSHRTPMFPEFDDYPQTNLRTADLDCAHRYQRWVDDQATRYEAHHFHAKKGQVLFWHGQMIHGGAPVTRPGVTRKSMVIHYSVRGADRGREVVGPFRW
jgi:ectoine hydroxylase-related dioxygenase (phytanoyl-CoA dioxygenase family)